jgi:hypothetical protein
MEEEMVKTKVRRRLAVVIALAMLASLIAVPMPASAAAGSFTGGPDQYPLHVPNDHTPFAVHFVADGSTVPTLAPNATYYLKVRLTVGTAPSGSTNRGFTWNPATGHWVQEREAWESFPTVTTDANGSIGSNMGWVFVKFGDDTKTAPYHLMISLSATGDASTFNGSFTPTITVFDPRTEGGWVHNGIAVASNKANKNARITDETSTTVLALQKTEAQGVDDDANGIVDDEDYGPVGNAGDFRMAVPASTVVKVNLNQAFWPSTSATFTTGPNDVDLALAATDTAAPTAPGALAASSGDGTASISWAPATDNVAVAGYHVYRWSPAPVGAAYSPVHARVATLAADATSFHDTGLTNGTTYLYEVRAFDAATNSGARSGPASVTPLLAAPTATVAPVSPDGENGWYRTVPLVTINASAPGLTSQYAFEAAPSTWTTYTAPVAIPSGVSTLYFRDTDGVTASPVQTLPFMVDTAAPATSISAPTFSVQQTATRSFTVSWSGADSMSGVAVYDVDVRTGTTGAWAPLRASTAATSVVFTGSLGSTYYFRSRATDVAGNTSEWKTTSGTTVAYDQSKAHFSHSWKSGTRSSAFMGSYKYSTARNAYATFTLSKGSLYLVTTLGPKNGKMAIYFRGRKVRTLDTYSKTTKYRQLRKIATFSGHGAGTVKIVNLATSHRPRIEIDGLAVR